MQGVGKGRVNQPTMIKYNKLGEEVNYLEINQLRTPLTRLSSSRAVAMFAVKTLRPESSKLVGAFAFMYSCPSFFPPDAYTRHSALQGGGSDVAVMRPLRC